MVGQNFMTVEEVAQELSDDYFASTGKRVSFLKEAEDK